MRYFEILRGTHDVNPGYSHDGGQYYDTGYTISPVSTGSVFNVVATELDPHPIFDDVSRFREVLVGDDVVVAQLAIRYVLSADRELPEGWQEVLPSADWDIADGDARFSTIVAGNTINLPAATSSKNDVAIKLRGHATTPVTQACFADSGWDLAGQTFTAPTDPDKWVLLIGILDGDRYNLIVNSLEYS